MTPRSWDRVLVGSFSRRRLQSFRRLSQGRVATSAAPLEVAAFRLLPSGRLADLVTGRQLQALQIPVKKRWLTLATPSLVRRRAHAAGKQVHVWTVDDPDEMRMLRSSRRRAVSDQTVRAENGAGRARAMEGGPVSEPIADLAPLVRARDQRAWYWSRLGQQRLLTTVATVLLAVPSSASADAAVENEPDRRARASPVGLGPFRRIVVTFSTLLSALLLPPLGAFIDRSGNKKGCLLDWRGPEPASRRCSSCARDDNWRMRRSHRGDRCRSVHRRRLQLVVNELDPAGHLTGERT